MHELIDFPVHGHFGVATGHGHEHAITPFGSHHQDWRHHTDAKAGIDATTIVLQAGFPCITRCAVVDERPVIVAQDIEFDLASDIGCQRRAEEKSDVLERLAELERFASRRW